MTSKLRLHISIITDGPDSSTGTIIEEDMFQLATLIGKMNTSTNGCLPRKGSRTLIGKYIKTISAHT